MRPRLLYLAEFAISFTYREKTAFPELLEGPEKMGRWVHREVGVQLESLGYKEHG